MLVSEILAIKGKVLFTISPNKHVAEAVEIMNEQDVGSLVVFSRGEMVGMLTFREVLQEVQRAGSEWQALAIDDVMIRNPQVASPNMEMDELRRMMVEHTSVTCRSWMGAPCSVWSVFTTWPRRC